MGRHYATGPRAPKCGIKTSLTNVQFLLPQLATYLGHGDIRSTQRYLQMTPDLLQAANQRFIQYALGGSHEE